MKQLKKVITFSSVLVGAAAVIMMIIVITMNVREFGCAVAPEALFIHPETGAVEQCFVHRSVREGDHIVVLYNKCTKEYVQYKSDENPKGNQCESADDLFVVKIISR